MNRSTNGLSGVCFDLFNTLLDVANVPESVGRFTADILGLDREVWRQACFGPHHDICRPTDAAETLRTLAHSLEPGISEDRIQQAVYERQLRFDYALRNIETPILDLLEQLKQQDLQLALVSNASSSEIQAWSQSPLSTFFDTSVFSCECGLQKPQEEIYRLALEQTGLGADETVYIGDGGSDEHFGAHRAGLVPVMVTYYLSDTSIREYREKYHHILLAEAQTPEEVLSLITKLVVDRRGGSGK